MKFFSVLIGSFNFYFICLKHDYFDGFSSFSSFQIFLVLLLVLRNGNSGIKPKNKKEGVYIKYV